MMIIIIMLLCRRIWIRTRKFTILSVQYQFCPIRPGLPICFTSSTISGYWKVPDKQNVTKHKIQNVYLIYLELRFPFSCDASVGYDVDEHLSILSTSCWEGCCVHVKPSNWDLLSRPTHTLWHNNRSVTLNKNKND